MTGAEILRRWAREESVNSIDMDSEADQLIVNLDETQTPTDTPSGVQTESTSSSRKTSKRKT